MIDAEHLKNQILRISKDLDLSHIGSNISALPVYIEIYEKKKPDSIVIADNAHSHLAHLVVKQAWLRKHNGFMILDGVQVSIEQLIEIIGIHCDTQSGCDASGGSLGHGIGIAIGYALADKTRDVYVIVSEGSMMEGSTWEALRIAEQLKLSNLKIFTNFNGYSAVAEIDQDWLERSIRNYAPSLDVKIYNTNNGEGFEGVQGHYKIL